MENITLRCGLDSIISRTFYIPSIIE